MVKGKHRKKQLEHILKITTLVLVLPVLLFGGGCHKQTGNDGESSELPMIAFEDEESENTSDQETTPAEVDVTALDETEDTGFESASENSYSSVDGQDVSLQNFTPVPEVLSEQSPQDISSPSDSEISGNTDGENEQQPTTETSDDWELGEVETPPISFD